MIYNDVVFSYHCQAGCALCHHTMSPILLQHCFTDWRIYWHLRKNGPSYMNEYLSLLFSCCVGDIFFQDLRGLPLLQNSWSPLLHSLQEWPLKVWQSFVNESKPSTEEFHYYDSPWQQEAHFSPAEPWMCENQWINITECGWHQYIYHIWETRVCLHMKALQSQCVTWLTTDINSSIETGFWSVCVFCITNYEFKMSKGVELGD